MASSAIGDPPPQLREVVDERHRPLRRRRSRPATGAGTRAGGAGPGPGAGGHERGPAVARVGPRRPCAAGPGRARPGSRGSWRRARAHGPRPASAGAAASVFGGAAAASVSAAGAAGTSAGAGRPGCRRGAGRAGRGGIELDRVLDVGGGLAELADALPERGAHVGKACPGPRTRRAITRMMTSSTGPMFGIALDLGWVDAARRRRGDLARRARIAQGGPPPSGGQPPRGARRDRRPAPDAPRAAAAIPRETLTSRPPPGPPPAGRPRRRPGRQHGCRVAALRADARHQEREARHERADLRELGRRRRPDDEAGPLAEPGRRDAPRHAPVERLRGRAERAGRPPPPGPAARRRRGWRSGTGRRRSVRRAPGTAPAPRARGTGSR